ncbi:MAG TPA: hypothetical protein VH165_00330 [Kofleriaceae bacterium]|jgi:hypothetical protein|nr:hypothetical protein [Kofleriaceae bacterium]
MRSLSKIFAISLLASAAVVGACGSSDSPPGPLAKHFDDMYIAAIPLDQKQSVVQSQNDWSLAKMQNAKSDADLNEAETQLSIVRNDLKAAQLGVDSANSAKKSADASADTNRMNQASKDQHAAEALAKAAELRVRYFEAYIDYLKTVQRHSQEAMYWHEAQYESAKAQVGQKGGIAPKGVAFDDFSKQEHDRGQREASSKDRVESSKAHAMSARDSWLHAQESADKENGHPTNLPDPMAAK